MEYAYNFNYNDLTFKWIVINIIILISNRKDMIKIPTEYHHHKYGKAYLMELKHYQRLNQKYRINIDNEMKSLNTRYGVMNYIKQH